jgi:hypothetical protein
MRISRKSLSVRSWDDSLEIGISREESKGRFQVLHPVPLSDTMAVDLVLPVQFVTAPS